MVITTPVLTLFGNATQPFSKMEPTEEKENDLINQNVQIKKRNNPQSNLSSSESEEQVDEIRNDTKKTKLDSLIESKETFTLPTIKIQPVFGGKAISFPVHPRLTLIDLKDFILFTLNIPHPQQVLSFHEETDTTPPGKVVLLSNFSDTTLLCEIPGLIDDITGRSALVSLSFKMSSGLDFSVHPSDLEYETSNGSNLEDISNFTDGSEGYFEISSDPSKAENSKISSLAASLATIIPFPPGVSKTSKMLCRSLSKSSPTNSNLPTLWEIYFPESGIKMIVTALINVSEVKGEGDDTTESSNQDKEKIEESKEIDTSIDEKSSGLTVPVPKLVITPDTESEKPTEITENSKIDLSPPASPSNEPKNHCEKCRIRCRPALKFICKCNKTFCQSHRYPDKHDCTYDHRAEGLAAIQANNPKIVKDKVSNF